MFFQNRAVQSRVVVSIYTSFSFLFSITGASESSAAISQSAPILAVDALHDQIADSDRQLHDWQLTPYDFCDAAVVHERFLKFSQISGAKLEAQRKLGPVHSVKEDVQSAVKVLTADGYIEGDTPAEASYEKAVNKGDATTAVALLARMTPREQSHEAEKEHRMADAVALLIPMADKGDVDAQRRIGSINTVDWEIKSPIRIPWLLHDYALAFKYYQMAAKNGDVNSQRWLGNLYSCGTGTKKNLVDAYVWYSLALSKFTSSKPTIEAWEITSKRDFIATKMTKDDIQRAKRLAIQCSGSDYRDCS